MTAARAHTYSCPQCRLTFRSRRPLGRHEALDHRPAPDGERLTALLVGAAPSEPAAAPAPTREHAPPSTPPPARRQAAAAETARPSAARLDPEAAEHSTRGPVVRLVLLVLLALVAGVLGALLEPALAGVALAAVALLAGGAVLARRVGDRRVPRR